jgi:predicted MFS family arabinose efflux permease
MIIQMVLMVAAGAIVLFFIMLELILILGAYQTNKTERLEQRPAVFHPELLRGILFFMFLANNLAGAILPLYSAALYRPVFNLPKAFIITLPFIAEPVFTVLALLVVPGIIGRFDLKRICLMGAIVTFIGHILCFIAPNILYLGFAYALIGFSGGTLILVINTIIGSQKSLEAVNQGFAHFNASYLSGINVGLVFGSMFAEFFPYRMVYLVSSLIAALLLAITIFSIRSNLVKHIYAVSSIKREYQGKEGNPWGLFRFLLRPAVLGTLCLLVLPQMASMSFVSYFTPVYGISQGLQESNIGQLMLLNGLFAILFGTNLCAYVSRKCSLKGIMFFSLFLNGGAIYLFSVTMSVLMLVVTIGIIAVANIFTMTNMQTYYATLYQNDIQVSSTKALSIYTMVENMGLVIGPLIFSSIAANTITKGMKLFSLSVLVCLGIFMVFSSVPKIKKQ